jgi:uncharacterized protein (TIGR02246 family)
MNPSIEQRSDEEAAIRAVESAYDVAWNAADVPAILGLFTEDAVLTNPFGETRIGRRELESMYEALFAGAGAGSSHTSRVLAIHFVRDDVALVDGEAVLEGFGTSVAPLRHRFTDVLVQSDHRWRISQIRAYVFMPRPGI